MKRLAALVSVKGFSFFCSVVLLVLAANTASASSVCPAPNGGSVGGLGVSSTYMADTTVSGGVVTNNTGCNVLITFGSLGAVSTTFPNAAPSYDSGGDDNLVGIVNNSGATITSISLSSATYDIFGFDGDGICGGGPGYTFVGGGSPCVNIIDTSYGTYGGPWVTYSGISPSLQSGVVNFANGGVPNGGSAFFSLEGPVDVSLAAKVGTPEPSSLFLLGTGLLGLFGVAKRKLFA